MAGRSALVGSVGEGGGNVAEDVGLVQILLNSMLGLQGKTLLAVDGIAGPLTIGAIRDFQAQFTGGRDGRVDPGGATFRTLVFAYVMLRRSACYRLKAFPPSFSMLAGQERPPAEALGQLLRQGLTDLRIGLAPGLKRPARGPAQKPQPKPQPPQSPPTVIDLA